MPPSSMRKRNVTGGPSTDELNNDDKLKKKSVRFADVPNIVERAKELIGNVVCSEPRRATRSNVKRIEEASTLKLVFLFVLVFSCSYYLMDYLHVLHNDTIATHEEEYSRLFLEEKCSSDYGNAFPSCAPKKCGRSIKDHLFDEVTLGKLKELATKGMEHGGGSGGATILDLHSGALSYKDKFVNIYKFKQQVFNETDFALYVTVKNKIRTVIAKEFGISTDSLYLAHPTFFSRIDSTPAVTSHDEYWHPHIDKVTYGTFFYTSLLYLSTYSHDFHGGRFVFVGSPCNKTIEPKLGRLSFFTSGSENQHFVEKVSSGVRYAITVSFTCDKKHASPDPHVRTN